MLSDEESVKLTEAIESLRNHLIEKCPQLSVTHKAHFFFR